MIYREISENIKKDWLQQKAIVLLGPRQVGKTTLMQELVKGKNVLNVNGDDPHTRMLWSDISIAMLQQMTKGYDVVLIDEAQRIENIGLTVKMMIDIKLNCQVFVTGSSSLDLAGKINEPLTGRKWEYRLFPLSWREVKDHYTFAKAYASLHDYLIFGMYPEVVQSHQKQRVLSHLAGSYLYKDILELTRIKKPEVLSKLLRAVALQLGNEVSYNELAKILNIDRLTVINYLDLLEKAFVIFRLMPYSTNQRNEITSKPKIYFYDNGIRNAIIGQFSDISNRTDQGALFENFIVSEKIKRLGYDEFYGQTYYWRNTQQAEIDFLEIADNKINAYEIKFSADKKARFSKSFTEKYKPENTITVNSSNFWEYL